MAGVRIAPLTIEAAVGSSSPPEPMHKDPADRLLIATARDLGVPLVTRDGLILAYANDSNALSVIPC
jgi:PIN domain nuclease of toxin-antitoxin system